MESLLARLKCFLLGCKNEALRHVMSFRRQVFMFLNEPDLDVSFRVLYEGKAYMIYANTGSLKCYECGGVGYNGAFPLHGSVRFTFRGFSTGYCTWYLVLF